MSRIDPHSSAGATEPRTRHLRLSLDVDFDAHVLRGTATHELHEASGGAMHLDTRGLAIKGVRTGTGEEVPFALSHEEPVIGRPLRLDLPVGTRVVTITYETSPDAIALQWLSPAQTDGKRHPFLFSQCQQIHARTMVPVQDTPARRVTYEARITVPEALSAVMSAGPAGVEAGPRPGTHTFLFAMPQAIPTYLLALAVGDLQSRDLSPRARVWAEPGVVESAAWEFAGVEDMIRAAESMFGPYDWDRYDMLVLPPSFPYGGMENPRMTFLTPTLLAGDRSLVDVVAHELAHSWTGNLVTNATMEHFWLNEGFTVWAERRITEALHGPEAAAFGWEIGGSALEREFARLGAGSALTKLRLELDGIDPDDAFSTVPYEKGARFLALCERTAGREAWDGFVRAYMAHFRFQSLTTEQFVAFLDEKLPGITAAVNAPAWISEPGLPDNTPRFHSERLAALSTRAAGFASGDRPTAEEAKGWSTDDLLVYLQKLPRPLPPADCQWLDDTLKLTGRGNYEVLVEWLTIAATSDFEPVFARLREVLVKVGRMKYLRPLYKALGATERTRALAREIYAEAAPGYHAVGRHAAQSVFASWEVKA